MAKYGGSEGCNGKPSGPTHSTGEVGDVFKSLNDKGAAEGWPTTPAPGKGDMGLAKDVPIKRNSSILSSGAVELPREGGPGDRG